MTQRHENHKVMSPVPSSMFGHLLLHDIQLVAPSLGHMTLGIVQQDATVIECTQTLVSYIDFEVTVLFLSCTTVLSILFYRSVHLCVQSL